MVKMDMIDKEFVEIFKNMGRAYGLSDLPLKVIGILYLEPDEIAMEEIAKKTGYSLASVSNTMKFLVGAGMVQRVKKPGSKKLFYFMDKNLIKLNLKKLEAVYENMIWPLKDQLPSLIRKYKEKVKDETSKKKLEIIENYYKQVTDFESLIEKWKKDLQKLL